MHRIPRSEGAGPEVHDVYRPPQEALRDRATETEARLLERVQSGAERMRLLNDDLLEYSHVSLEGRATERIDLNEKLQGCSLTLSR